MTSGTRRHREMRKLLRLLFPRIPMSDAEPLLAKALAGHLRHLPPSIALHQAATTYIRHELTCYDALLKDGYDRDAARYFVADDINDVLVDWGSLVRVDQQAEASD